MVTGPIDWAHAESKGKQMDWGHLFESRGRADRPDLDETVVNGAPFDYRKSDKRTFARPESPAKARNAKLADDLRRRALRMMETR